VVIYKPLPMITPDDVCRASFVRRDRSRQVSPLGVDASITGNFSLFKYRRLEY
jgi:hypothetical protein